MIVIDMANFRTLDLNLLRVLDAMMETRNVTRASEVLGLSQPAVSAALARLREHLKDPLFVRVGNGMAPTPHVEAIAPALRRALDDIRETLAQMEPFDPSSAETVFTLRGADFFSVRLMPHVAGRIAEEAPGVSVRFLDSGFGDMVDLLKAGAVDLAMEQPMEVPQWVSRALLFPSPFKIVAAQDNPGIATEGLRTGDVLPMSLYCSLPHALRSTDGSMSGMADVALASEGKRRRVALALPHFDAIIRAVAQSRMIATVPVQLAAESAVQHRLVILEPPFEIPVPKMQFYWHSRTDRTPGQVWFRDLIREETARLWGRDESFD